MISASEMILVALRVENYRPKNDAVKYEWHRVSGGRPDTIIFSYTSSDFPENPNWTTYWSFDSTYVGHFSWKIDLPGHYYVILTTPWGDARIDFAVVD